MMENFDEKFELGCEIFKLIEKVVGLKNDFGSESEIVKSCEMEIELKICLFKKLFKVC